jgi:signal transduction histidine kinase
MVTPSDHATPARAGGDSRGTVLVIDDERGPRESLRIVLKTKYRVVCADSVDSGVELLKQESPDVIIMDIRMPGKSGIEGLRAIRALDSHAAVIMLTGFGALETAQEAIRLGATDYLKKPFDVHEIQEIIQRYMGRTQVERRRRQAQAELMRLNQTLQEEVDRKNHLAAMGQKSAELVHDLKNPLTAVLGYLDLLTADLKASQDKLGDRWQDTLEYLGNIEASVLRCRDLSGMWLDISRGRQNRTSIPICTLVQTVVRECRHLAEQKQIQFTAEVMTDEVMIGGDRLQITRVIQNLVVNALEAVQPGQGCVKVWCREAGANLEVGVQDNGCGMSPDQVQSAFEPFFTTKKGTGTGLGLFITRQAVEAHGGTIRIESDPGKGTLISVSLPRN